jgi:hypothetical protein
MTAGDGIFNAPIFTIGYILFPIEIVHLAWTAAFANQKFFLRALLVQIKII